MAKEDAAIEVTPVLREDGTVYFDYARKARSEIVYEIALACLWFLMPLVVAGVLIWY
jgi:hypothetical protein